MTREVEARESAQRALNFYGLEVDNLSGIEETMLLSFVWVDDDTTYSWETRDELHTGLVCAYRDAILAAERERTAALVEAARAVFAGLRLPSEEGFLKLDRLSDALRAYEEGVNE